MIRRKHIPALAAIAALALAGGCGGDESKPEPISGASAASPGAPEFGERVVRVPGFSPLDVAASALLATYPPGESAAPSGWVLYPQGDWRLAVAAAQFAAAPVDGAPIPTERKFFPTPILDLIERISPSGFPKGGGLETILLGSLGEEIIIDLQRQNLKLTELTAPSAAGLAGKLAPYRGGYAEEYSDTVIAVSSEEAGRDYALAAAAWSAFSGDTVVFVTSGGVPAETLDILSQREELRTRQPAVYVLGPESLVPDSVLAELGAVADKVERVPGDTPTDAAIELARFSDEETGFGFATEEGPANLTLVNTEEDWQNAYAGLLLAGAGPRAPLIPIDGANRPPQALVEYLRELESPEPSHVYVLGDRKGISSPMLARLDALTEPAEGKAKRRKAEGSVG